MQGVRMAPETPLASAWVRSYYDYLHEYGTAYPPAGREIYDPGRRTRVPASPVFRRIGTLQRRKIVILSDSLPAEVSLCYALVAGSNTEQRDETSLSVVFSDTLPVADMDELLKRTAPEVARSYWTRNCFADNGAPIFSIHQGKRCIIEPIFSDGPGPPSANPHPVALRILDEIHLYHRVGRQAFAYAMGY